MKDIFIAILGFLVIGISTVLTKPPVQKSTNIQKPPLNPLSIGAWLFSKVEV